MITGAVSCWYIACAMCVVTTATDPSDRIAAMTAALAAESRFTTLEREMALELCGVRREED